MYLSADFNKGFNFNSKNALGLLINCILEGAGAWQLQLPYECFPNCQNPNLTTTQPQPNLYLVGFDTIITLHTPHPTHPPHPTPQELYFYQKE